jgi:hypothetical protein
MEEHSHNGASPGPGTRALEPPTGCHYLLKTSFGHVGYNTLDRSSHLDYIDPHLDLVEASPLEQQKPGAKITRKMPSIPAASSSVKPEV